MSLTPSLFIPLFVTYSFLREYSTNHYSVISYFISRFTMEALITAMQVRWLAVYLDSASAIFHFLASRGYDTHLTLPYMRLWQYLIAYWLIGFQGSFGLYYSASYTLAMASTAIAVLLGCSVEDPKLAQEMLPILFVPQLLFAGFFVATELIPAWLRWAQYLCSLTYAVRITLVEEFGDCYTDFCRQTLDNTNANADDTWWYWLVLVLLFAVFRISALIILRKKATKFFY